ncbi:MAG: HlyD family efflux transporter periplasmic adaptor subunit [Gemmatimonadales bacterium]|nr:HlyD family efflux transporter periplasmic adaptor subunit [Gemmatimonadales bacterium]
MDVARTKPTKNRTRTKVAVATVALAVVTFAISQLKPAAPSVERNTLSIDSVVAGPMVREVRAPGSLVPEQIRWISAVAPGRVEKKLVQPGERVTANTILMELSNPDVEIQLLQAERQLTDAQAQLVSLQVSLETQRLTQAGTVAQVRAAYLDATRNAAANKSLVDQRMISAFEAAKAQDLADELTERYTIERQRLTIFTDNIPAQLAVQREQVARLKAVVEFQRSLAGAMTVRAGTDGVLQELPLEVGQFATSGTTIAKVVQPERLKAVLRVQENQARDVTLGQTAVIDTRNGLVRGRVSRIDPSSTGGMVSVDVALLDTLPKGARPDLSIDGTIEIERLGKVLHTGRPTYGQANSTIGLFKLSPDGGEAVRVQVALGRTSANAVEIVSGLAAGDQVILSDMTRFDAVDRVRVK